MTLYLIMRNFTKINELSGIAVPDSSFILVKFCTLVKHKNTFFDREQKIAEAVSSSDGIGPKEEEMTNGSCK